jgi:hypothetical protein
MAVTLQRTGPAKKEGAPEGPNVEISGHHTTNTLDIIDDNGSVRQARLRRAASWRLPPKKSGYRSDPWFYEPPTAGYVAAAHHLLDHGLIPAPNIAAMQLMWRQGGPQRRAAARIAEAWNLAVA